MVRPNIRLYAIIEIYGENKSIIFKFYETYEEAEEVIERMKKWDKKFGREYIEYQIEEYVINFNYI